MNKKNTLLYEYAATNLLTGTFEVVKSGRHRYYFDSAGSLSRDVSRGMNVSYDINGSPVFLAFNAGSETESGYTTDGVTTRFYFVDGGDGLAGLVPLVAFL